MFNTWLYMYMYEYMDTRRLQRSLNCNGKEQVLWCLKIIAQWRCTVQAEYAELYFITALLAEKRRW